MFPELFHIGSFWLPSYGLLVALGVLAGLSVAARLAQRAGVDSENAWNLGALVVAAGLFYYVARRDVRHFLVQLSNRFACQVLFDACSPLGMRIANQRVIHSSGLGSASELKWGMRDPRVLLGWDTRFRLLRTYSYFAGNLWRLPVWLWLPGLLSDDLRLQYMVQMEL